MSPLLVALLGVLLLPLFVGSWRASLVGLGGQALLIALIAYRFEHAPGSPGAWLVFVDLVVVRGLVAPLALSSVLRAQNAPARNDVIPANLLSWTFALGIVLLSFGFADRERPREEIGPLAPKHLAVAVVEGFRGEVVHCLETDDGGRLAHYKVQDPSLRNWMSLAIAVRGNDISDFPICNKSFDLSYCGNDL